MHLAEEQLDGYRVYAAALEAPGGGGYRAGVVVRHFPVPSQESTEAFRDELLDDGRTWTSPDEALAFALEVGRAALRAQELLVHEAHLMRNHLVAPYCSPD